MAAYLEMRHITKVYPNGTVANNDASLSVERGEIHAIAGENGAGKSTIMKVLYGAEKADGEIYLDGKRVRIDSPRTANALGIGMVYQHFMLVNEFTGWENIFFGVEDTNPLGVLHKKAMKEKAEALCKKFAMPVDLDAKCGEMSVSMAQKVEILKVLARGAHILILDEPTAVLTPQEIEELFKQLRLLKKDGYTIIIITHKLKEMTALCDRITIMRDGATVGVKNVAEVDEAEISRLMVGRDINLKVQKEKAKPEKTVLSVEHVSINGVGEKKAVRDVSFQVREGEILCIAGVEGNGQREIVEAITGERKHYEGSILLSDISTKGASRKALRARGMAHIPEDRIRTGADVRGSIYDNLISLDFAQNSLLGFIKSGKLKKRGNEQIERYGIKGTLNQSLGSLSGGNMQKVVVARELDSDPSLVVADQPTRGVDVGAIEAIHKKIVEMRNLGKAVLLISADLSEVFSLADRIIVFHEGEITAEIEDPESIDEIQLGRYMLGLERKVAES